MKFYQSGRSMVEMLGVLAIIGVLSVGAIAGYSKAMMKYRLNKQLESISQLLSYSLVYLQDFPTDGTRTKYNELLDKLNLIPDGMYFDKSTSKIYDNFDNSITLYRNQSDDGSEANVLSYILEGNDSFSKQLCMNIIEAARLNSFMLHSIKVKESDGNTSSSSDRLWGDKLCKDNLKCLRNYLLSDAENMCVTCMDKEKSCYLQIIWQY